MAISICDGPTRLMRDRDGFVVIEFDSLPPEAGGGFVVRALGWGAQAIADGPDLKELANYAEKRFGEVRIRRGCRKNPNKWKEASW